MRRVLSLVLVFLCVAGSAGASSRFPGDSHRPIEDGPYSYMPPGEWSVGAFSWWLYIGLQWWDGTGRGADSVQITSLPYTMSTSGTATTRKVYYLTGDLTSASDGITVSCDSCILNLQGHTVTFDNDAGGTAKGLYVSGGVDYFYAHSGTITQWESPTEILNGCYGGSTCDAIQLAGTLNWITIRNVSGHVYGYNSACIDGDTYGTAHKAVQVLADPDSVADYSNYSMAFSSRYTPESYAIKLSRPAASPDTFNYEVRNVNIMDAPHLGIACGGWAEVVACTVWIDQRNLDPAAGSGNAHAIADAGAMWAGSRIDSNLIRCGTTYYGGRGVYLNYGGGTAERPISLSWNDMVIHSGDPGNGDSPQARGMKFRWGPGYVNVIGNHITIELDDNAGTGYMWSGGHGIYIQSDYEQDGSCPMTPYRPMHHIVLRENDIRIKWLGSRSWDYNTQAACLVIQHLDSAVWDGYNDFNYCENNAYRTLTTAVVLSHDQGCFSTDGDLEGWIFSSDTFIVSNGTDAPQAGDTAFTLGFCSGNDGSIVAGWGGGKNVSNVRIVNPVFVNTTADSVKAGNGSGDKGFYYERTALVTVTTSGGSPVTGAAVKIVNQVTGDTVYSGVTDGSGQCRDTLAIRYLHWTACTKDQDQIYDHKFIAALAGDTVIVQDTLDLTTQAGDDYPVTMAGLAAGGDPQPQQQKLDGITIPGIKVGVLDETLNGHAVDLRRGSRVVLNQCSY